MRKLLSTITILTACHFSYAQISNAKNIPTGNLLNVNSQANKISLGKFIEQIYFNSCVFNTGHEPNVKTGEYVALVFDGKNYKPINTKELFQLDSSDVREINFIKSNEMSAIYGVNASIFGIAKIRLK